MAGESHKDEALSLLAATNNHGDLNVKLSSLNKLKDVLLSMEPSSATEVFPYLAELQSSPESLVRKLLVEVIEDVGLKAIEHYAILLSVLLALLRDGDTVVASQSIVSGTKFFLFVLEEMTVQFHQRGKVERWVEEVWIWMVRFKDIVFDIALQPGSVGPRIPAFKFLETFVLIFTPDSKEYDKTDEGSRGAFNISWLAVGHPVIDPGSLMSEANRTLVVLLNLLRSSGSLPGPLTIVVVNCLAAIARKRPQYYDTVISALFDFDPNSQTAKGCHAASIQYSLRTAFLGFLRCTYPPMLESRDQLVKSLRAMNAGDAADQVIRQVDKMIKNGERTLRETRVVVKDEQQSSQPSVSGDLVRKRYIPLNTELVTNGHEPAPKRICAGPDPNLSSDSGKDSISTNGVPPNIPLLDDLTAVEQMIAMIGALLAEGERGAESLQILISKIHPDLLADIVITNMRHLPKAPPPLTMLGNSPVSQLAGQPATQAHLNATPVLARPLQSSAINSEVSPISNSSSMPDGGNILASDPKRDPRRDPRRLDPRRAAVSVSGGGPCVPTVDESVAVQSESENSVVSKPISYPIVTANESPPLPFPSKITSEDKISQSMPVSTDISTPKDELPEGPGRVEPSLDSNSYSEHIHTTVDVLDEDQIVTKLSDTSGMSAMDMSSNLELDESYPSISSASASEDTCAELPILPSYIELSRELELSVKTTAVKHIIESFKHINGTDCQQMCMSLLARLIAQIDDEDILINMLQKHILDDQRRKGHELVLHILYHLHSLMVLGSDENLSSADVLYEKFLLAVVNSLLDSFPASDKSFSRLLGEVPFLPESALKLLSDLCYSDVIDHLGKPVRDVERVTQGLGAVWSLILGRPKNRQDCLAIALKCAAHPQDEIRAKAIRLVANKLYLLRYSSEDIEQCATNMLLSAVDHQVSDMEPSQSGSTEQRAEGEVENHETSISGSQVSEPAISENDSLKVAHVTNQSHSSISFSEAQRLVSLYFALCTKKPSLLQMVFNIYGRAPRAVKQAFHRHIPIVMRAIGQSYSDLLHIISDPPQGSENLLSLVLQILTQETTPSSELIATVKHLYETKLKDVSILVPMLSSLSKSEVLPIFPRLVELPLEKFQMALAHILQGSAHTGPALTPVEVLVAIHNVSPEKDGLPLKKIMDACSACFEQRTVFTQQVLAKALNQMVDQTPLPLLFMRTVIQAIDAFPTLVDFLMEILSKLVSKQVWRMPKLWVGFLKCVSQTQPRSFHVLLQLPSPQLESALNKYANLRGPLAAYANQPSVKSSLPRSTLAVLGLVNETHNMQQHVSSLRSSDSGSSVHGATMTQ